MGLKFLMAFLFIPAVLFSQEFTLSGNVKDDAQQPISFVTILVSQVDKSQEPAEIVSTVGTTTDDFGNFNIGKLVPGIYTVSFSYIGFSNISEEISITEDYFLGTTYLSPETESLDATVIAVRKPTVQKEAGKLTFNVENTSLSTGSTFDLLKKTPGVIVIGEEIKIKFTNPVVYINNKRVYLSSSEVVSLLQNTDASNIKSVEVITSPGAKYDGATGTVLNINTVKAISIGYKGSINANYTQGVFPKYRLGTSHFYKNEWLNFYGSYGFNGRKDYKEDDNFIRYFEPDGSTNSLWNSDFNRTTRSNAHQGNIVADVTIDDKQSISLASTLTINPNETYNNNGFTSIRNPQMMVDSTFTTLSDVRLDTQTLSVNLDYTLLLNDEDATLVLSTNYTDYKNERLQDVATEYNNPAGTVLQQNSFFTDANQGTNIFTGQADVTYNLWKGTLETGAKFSAIDSNSKLDFFDTDVPANPFNEALSDDFNYLENIYATYINFQRSFDKLRVNAGVRGEYTDIEGRSRSLGDTNTNNYFNLFPRVSLDYKLNDKNSVGVAYTRSIERPRYQNLNPFRYFINENNFNQGNPFLVPAIKDKIAASYAYKGILSFEAYYETIDNALSTLIFQDNVNRTLRNSEANLLNDFQYSFDIQYTPRKLPDWLYFYVITSTYYLESEFLALESPQTSSTNSTAGIYGYVYSNFTLSKDRTFTADLSSQYISNLITGSADYDNLFFLNVSFRKSFWNKQASITAGVNDIFNRASNSPVVSNYLNQDNFYRAQEETRVFTLGLKYNFGNARLRDNNKSISTDEKERLE